MKIERLGVLLSPDTEKEAKFNAGMVRSGDTVHMLYRYAQILDYEDGGKVRYSANQIHYARLSREGTVCEDRFDEPVLFPHDEWDRAGCEDPRIVLFEGRYYIFYSAFDGTVCRVGVAVTDDFSHFERLGVIPTRQWDKDAFIFPERIGGKIAYMHRIEPDIEIDFFDRMEDLFEDAFWENYHKQQRVLLTGVQPWENQRIGGSVPPIKTPIGWLIIYHGVSDDRVPFCYRAGAALLDLDDPTKVIARLPEPLLSPQTDYECVGDVNNVVFPQGAYLDGEWLVISYGAADKRVALARVRFDELLKELDQNRI